MEWLKQCFHCSIHQKLLGRSQVSKTACIIAKVHDKAVKSRVREPASKVKQLFSNHCGLPRA